jgi:hypothetical protein
MVNISNDEFVTGQSREQTRKRFEAMHPGAEGWMERFSDVIDESNEPAANEGTTGESPSGCAINSFSWREKSVANLVRPRSDGSSRAR